jgi:hypothetical protein
MKFKWKPPYKVFLIVLVVCAILLVTGVIWWVWQKCYCGGGCKPQEDVSVLQSIPYYRLQYPLDVNTPSLEIIKTFKDANHNFSKAKDYHDAKFLMFDSLDLIEDYMQGVLPPHACTHVYGVAGTDIMASKSSLVVHMKERLPVNVFTTVLPVSYVLPHDIPKMLMEGGSDDIWILKKNIQRQEGQLITDNVDVLGSAAQDGSFVVAQKMLRDPFLVNGRKINLRVYMLVVANQRGVKYYYYTNGFMYYTPKMFRYSTDKDEVITTGYIDRRVYEENPLTLDDFKNWLGSTRGGILFDNIHKTMGLVSYTFREFIRDANLKSMKSHPHTRFLIYGVDLAPDTNLNIKIMEINKGPDLSYKDQRDAAVKLNMVKDALALVGLGGEKSGQFTWVEV